MKNLDITYLTKPEILVLDLDLTLHDVIAHYDYSINETMLHFGHKILSDEQLEQAGVNFTSTKEMFASLLPKSQIDAAVEYYFNHFMNREIPVNAVLPGAEALLTQVKTKLPIIGVTNLEQFMAKKVLRDLKLFDKFDYVIGVKEGNLPKPEIQMLITALSAIGASNGKHVWFVGDRLTDTQCAKAADCTAIRFYHKIKPNDQYADLFVNDHFQLYDIINRRLEC
jgi:phosphoglycolate phosphatase